MPGPGRIINQGVLNSKTSRNCQELPGLELIPFNWGIYRTALREREDDILPYGGRGIFAGAIQWGAFTTLWCTPPLISHDF